MFVLHMQVTLAVICSNIIHITASVPKYQHWDIVSTFMMKYFWSVEWWNIFPLLESVKI